MRLPYVGDWFSTRSPRLATSFNLVDVTVCAWWRRDARKKLATREKGLKPGPSTRQESPLGLDENPRTPAQAKPPAKQSGPIIGQRTTDIRNASKELKQGGAQVASTKNRRQRPDHGSGKCLCFDCRPVICRSRSSTRWTFITPTNDRYPKD